MPELEEETALANIALDLLGQARMLLARGESDDRERSAALLEKALDSYRELGMARAGA